MSTGRRTNRYTICATDDAGRPVPNTPDSVDAESAHEALSTLKGLGYDIRSTFGHTRAQGLAYLHLPASCTPHHTGVTLVAALDMAHLVTSIA